MCCGILKAAGGLGAIVALILVIVALLKQLILLVGFLLAALKIAIVVVFIAIARDDRPRDLSRSLAQAPRERNCTATAFQQTVQNCSASVQIRARFSFPCTFLIFPRQSCNTSVACDRVRAFAEPAGWISPRRDLEVSIQPLQIFK